MSSSVIGLIGIGILVMLFLIRMPIAFAMLSVGILGFIYLVSPEAGLSLLGHDVFAQLTNYSLTVIPMFVLAGSIAFEAGMGERLFDGAYAMFGRLPGSLAIAATVASAGLGAVTGSSVAVAAAVGRMSLPAMKKYNYDDSLATGSIAAAGTLGVLIPPSMIFVIYAMLTEQSIGKLFIAGILPGILLTSLFVMTILLHCRYNKSLAPRGPASSRKQKMAGLVGLGEISILFILVIGGIARGWFSPTQGGGVLVAGVSLLAVARRQISWRGFITALKDSARISCMVLSICIGGIVFGRFMAVSKLPLVLADWLGALSLPTLAVIGFIMLAHMIGGCFMDGMGLLLISMPVIFPTLIALDVDLIWFGVMIVVVGEMGMITPPVGITVYVIKGIAEDVPMITIFKGIVPFIGAIVICMAILVAFPQIATFLPHLITY